MNIKSANKNLLLLLLVFVLGIVFQAVLNYSFSMANEKLDNKNKQLFSIGFLVKISFINLVILSHHFIKLQSVTIIDSAILSKQK